MNKFISFIPTSLFLEEIVGLTFDKRFDLIILCYDSYCHHRKLPTLTCYQRPEVKIEKKSIKIFESFDPMFRYLSCYRSEIEVLTSVQRPEIKIKKQYHIWISWPKKPMFRYTSCYIILTLTSNQRPEVKKWPPRGQNEKNNAIFEFLDPKNLCLDIHHTTKVKFKRWPLIRGQR